MNALHHHGALTRGTSEPLHAAVNPKHRSLVLREALLYELALPGSEVPANGLRSYASRAVVARSGL